MMGCHHGTLTPLPQDWEFPSMTWTQLIQNWFLGDLESNVPPLMNLNSKIVNHCNGGSGNKMRLNMKATMRIVEVEAHAKGCWKEKEKWTATSVKELIDSI